MHGPRLCFSRWVWLVAIVAVAGENKKGQVSLFRSAYVT